MIKFESCHGRVVCEKGVYMADQLILLCPLAERETSRSSPSYGDIPLVSGRSTAYPEHPDGPPLVRVRDIRSVSKAVKTTEDQPGKHSSLANRLLLLS